MRTLLQTLVLLAACLWLPSLGQVLSPGWGVPSPPQDSRTPWVKCSADNPADPALPGSVSCLSGGGSQQHGYGWQQLPGGLPPLALYHRHHYLSDGRIGCSVERGYRTRHGDSTLRCSAVSKMRPPAATWPWGQAAVPLPPWKPCALPPLVLY